MKNAEGLRCLQKAQNIENELKDLEERRSTNRIDNRTYRQTREKLVEEQQRIEKMIDDRKTADFWEKKGANPSSKKFGTIQSSDPNSLRGFYSQVNQQVNQKQATVQKATMQQYNWVSTVQQAYSGQSTPMMGRVGGYYRNGGWTEEKEESKTIQSLKEANKKLHEKPPKIVTRGGKAMAYAGSAYDPIKQTTIRLYHDGEGNEYEEEVSNNAMASFKQLMMPLNPGDIVSIDPSKVTLVKTAGTWNIGSVSPGANGIGRIKGITS